MKRVAVIAIILLVMLALCGCNTGKVDSQKIAEAKFDNKMFMMVSTEYYGLVLVDKSTRIMYWMSAGAYSTGNLTVLVNRDGTPRIWEE